MNGKMTWKIMIFMLAAVLILGSCGGGGGDEKDTDAVSADTEVSGATDTDAETIMIENISEYRIVRSDSADGTVKNAASTLSDALSEVIGSKPKMATDFGGESEYEIIVGETKRDASTSAYALLSSDLDYVIKKDGNKIVIIGKSSESTEKAVKYFIQNYVSKEGVCVPAGEGYLFMLGERKDIKIDGVALEEYCLSYLANASMLTGNYDEVSELGDRIGQASGVSLDIVVSTSADKRKSIVYDAGLLDYTKGSISVEDGKLYLRGSYHSMPTVVDRFIEMLVDGADITGTIDIDTGDLPDSYTRQELYDVLEYVYNDNSLLILGDEINNSRQLPSTFFDLYVNGGGTWSGTGKMPSIVGGDLGRCGLKLPTLPDEYKHIESRYICELIDYASKGGIVTIGCHMTNPTGDFGGGSEDRGTLGDESAWHDLVTEGTELNRVFKSELELDAEFLLAFKNAGVPVIWRPFHEMNGGWFWFHPFNNGQRLDASVFVEMWKYVYDLFTNEYGLDNLIWCYSPNNSNGGTDVLYCYPGDEYVDIMGLDWYTSGGYEIDGSGKSYANIMSKGKITVLAEMGISGSLVSEKRDHTEQEGLFTAEDFVGIIYSMFHDDYKVAYLMTYNDVHSLSYMPLGDEVSASDFILTLDEMPALFEKVRNLK